MKKPNFFLLTILFGLLFASCGKDAATVPKNSAVANGSTGAPGTTNPIGVSGATEPTITQTAVDTTIANTSGSANSFHLYVESTAPTISVGANGDYYVDLVANQSFGPKTPDGWGQPGTVIFFSFAPTASVGSIGEFCIAETVTTTATKWFLYGPKTTTGWGAPIRLIRTQRTMPW